MKNIFRRINITIKSEPAVASVCPSCEIFLDDLSAPGANLTRVLWINFDNWDTGTLSLIRQFFDKAAHCNVKTAFCKVFVAVHEYEFKVFKHNSIMLFDQIKSKFVQKVCSLISYVFVKFSESSNGLMPGVRAFFLSGNRPLQHPELLLAGDVMLRRIVKNPVRGGGKMRNAEVDPDNTTCPFSGRNKISINRETDVPLVIFPKNADLFDIGASREFSMPFHTDWRQFCQNQLAIFNLCAIPISKSNTGKSGCRLESWKPCLPSFAPAKERLKGNIKFSHSLLERRAIYLWVFCFAHLVERFILIKRRKREFIDSVGVYTLFQGLIVKATMTEEYLVKCFNSGLVGIYSIFKSFQSLAFLIRNILFNRLCRYMPSSPAIVRPAPKGWKLAPQFSELPSQQAAGSSFKSKSNPRWSPGWITFNKQVDVIRHYFESVNSKFVVTGYRVQYFFETVGDVATQHLAPIFWTPNKVIFEAENGPRILSIFTHTVYNKLCYTVCQPLILQEVANSSAS